MSNFLNKWNEGKFSIYKSEEKTTLKLIEDINNFNGEMAKGLDEKTDINGNHNGTWQGLNKPTLSVEGAFAQVEKNKDDILKINNNLNEMIVNVKDYGAKGDGTTFNEEAFNNAINTALSHANTHNGSVTVFIPNGVYKIGIYLSSLRLEIPASLKDLKGITIKGEGNNTIIKGESEIGFDVFQLNCIKNLTIKDLAIESVKTTGDTTFGCNGVSITNGSSNIHIENVFVSGLPYVVKESYVDGGKAFTVQDGVLGNGGCNNISIINCSSKNVAFGFEMDFDPKTNNIPNDISVRYNTFEAFYRGLMVASAQPLVNNFVAKTILDISCNTIIGAQQSLLLSRGCGVTVKNNKFINYKITTPTEVSIDTIVESIILKGCENIIVEDNIIYYEKCSNYMRLGGLASGATKFSSICNNIFTGNSDGKGIVAEDIGGAICQNSLIINNQFKNVALVEIDTLFYLPINKNTIISNTHSRFSKIGVNTTGEFSDTDMLINGNIGFAYTDGKSSYHKIKLHGTSIAVQQTASSTPTTENFSVLNNVGNAVFQIANNGAIRLNAFDTGAVGGPQSKKIPVYDITGTFVGYIPVYQS